MKAAVIGAGSWGTALGCVLADNNHEVTLWARDEELAAAINRDHVNHAYFPEVTLPKSLAATPVLASAVRDAVLVLYVVPSRAVRSVAEQIAPHLRPQAHLAHAVKGFDPTTRSRISQVLASIHPNHADQIAVIGGPSHAEEVISRMPTAIVSAAATQGAAEFVQGALMTPYLRTYTQSDVVGVELGGSLKNIIALGVGIADGLGYGDNAKAAVMTRGLAEISRLGIQLGANPLTFAGLAGVGDLIATCTSRHSRNLRAGRLIGQGTPVEDVEATIGMVVEGIPAIDAALQLASQHHTEMPITQALAAVMHHALDPTEAVMQLMGRERRHESAVEAPPSFW